MSIKDVLDKAQKVEPIARVNGMDIVSFDDQMTVAQADMVEGYDLGNRTLNADGTVARSRVKYASVNVENFYINRFKKTGKSYLVVNDYRAIKEQSTGRVYLKQIPAYEIKRDEETKQLKLSKITTVSDTEFIADFTHTFTREAMAEIMPLLTGGAEVTAEHITI